MGFKEARREGRNGESVSAWPPPVQPRRREPRVRLTEPDKAEYDDRRCVIATGEMLLRQTGQAKNKFPWI
jgi:hypothetical protein